MSTGRDRAAERHWELFSIIRFQYSYTEAKSEAINAFLAGHASRDAEVAALNARNTELEGQCWEYVKRIDDLKAILDRCVEALEEIGGKYGETTQLGFERKIDKQIANEALAEIKAARSGKNE